MTTKPVNELARETAIVVIRRGNKFVELDKLHSDITDLIQSALDQQTEKYEAALKVATDALESVYDYAATEPNSNDRVVMEYCVSALTKIKELMP